MLEICLNATLKEKVSQKKGTTYYVIEVELTPNCKKEYFLEPAELELVKLFYQVVNKKDK